MKLNITNIKLFFLARCFSQVYFWIVVAVPYLLYRGISLEETYSILGFYSICVVVLEYPTGVIGDHYGHKLSQMLGNVAGIISILIVAQDGPNTIYYLAMFFNALGNSLISGSDEAHLKLISSNFKRDFKYLKMSDPFMLIFASIAGGYIANYSFELALYLSAVSYFLANIFYLFVKEGENVSKQNRLEGNLFSTANKGLKEIMKSRSLLALILFLAVIGMFRASVKNMLGSFEELFEVDVVIIGWLIGISMITRTIGIWFFDKTENINIKYFYVLMAGALALGYFDQTFIIPYIAMLISVTVVSIITARLGYSLNHTIPNEMSAGIISFKNLLERLLGTGYLYLFGFLIVRTSIGNILLVLAVALLIISLIYVKLNKLFEE